MGNGTFRDIRLHTKWTFCRARAFLTKRRCYDSRFWFHCSEHICGAQTPFWGKLSTFYIRCHLFLFGIGMWFGFCVFFKSCGVLWSANTNKVARTTMIAIRSFFFCMDGMWISDADVLDLVTFFKGWFVNLGRSEQCVCFLFGVCWWCCASTFLITNVNSTH